MFQFRQAGNFHLHNLGNLLHKSKLYHKRYLALEAGGQAKGKTLRGVGFSKLEALFDRQLENKLNRQGPIVIRLTLYVPVLIT